MPSPRQVLCVYRTEISSRSILMPQTHVRNTYIHTYTRSEFGSKKCPGGQMIHVLRPRVRCAHGPSEVNCRKQVTCSHAQVFHPLSRKGRISAVPHPFLQIVRVP